MFSNGFLQELNIHCPNFVDIQEIDMPKVETIISILSKKISNFTQQF